MASESQNNVKPIESRLRVGDENHDDRRLEEELESLYRHVARIDQPNACIEDVDQERGSEKSGAFKKQWIAVLIVLCLLAGGLTAGFLLQERGKGGFQGMGRLKNTFAFIVLRQKPHFYSLVLEKNGKDFHLSSQNVLEVSYEDEFVIKEVSTDVLFGGGVTVNVMGVGGDDDFGMPLKGIDLVDKAVLTGRDSLARINGAEFLIMIAYKGEWIASIPVRIQIDPKDWLRYARRSGNRKARIEYLKRAVTIDPKDEGVRKILAHSYLQAGMNGEAIAEYQYLLHLKPDDDVALANMALAWGNLGKWNEAAATYHAILKIRSDNPIVIFRLGEAYEKTNQLEKAAEQYRLVLKKVPKADNVANLLANVSMKMGKVDEAIRWYREVVKRQPKNAHAYASLGHAYGNKGQAREEIENYKLAVVLNPRDSITHFNLGVAHEKMGLFPEALKFYAASLELDPDSMKAAGKIQQMKILITQQQKKDE